MYIFSLIIFCFLLPILSGSFNVLVEYLLFLGAGHLLIVLFCRSENRRDSVSIYHVLMLFYGIYLLICHLYRTQNGLHYIGSLDGVAYYLPSTLRLIDIDSWDKIVGEIFDNTLYHTGGAIFLYFVLIARMALNWLHIDLCLAIQMSLMPFAALICVVTYNLLIAVDMPRKSAYRWSILFGLCSALFWLSSFIVRDLPINLTYVILIYLIFADVSMAKKIFLGGLCVALAIALRLASGLAAIPLLLLSLYGKISNRAIKLLGVIAVVSVLFSYHLDRIFEEKLTTINRGYLMLELRDQSGNSTLSSFNRLPWGVSHTVKLIYAQFHPFPAWRNMTPNTDDMRHVYNATKFPDIWCVFFRLLGLFILIFGLINRESRKVLMENRIMLYSFLYSLLLLLIQSMTIEERRKMSVYPVLVMIIALFWQKSSPDTRRQAVFCALAVFGGLQLLALGKSFLSL